MALDGIFRAFDISRTGLQAQRTRMNVAANNLACINVTQGKPEVTVKDANGDDKVAVWEPYRRRRPFFAAGNQSATGSNTLGVTVTDIVEDPSDFKWVRDPNHPDAITEADVQRMATPEERAKYAPYVGYVRMPNVEHIVEMVEMMEASRTYEANITAMETSKEMTVRSLRILA
jgi:flagellar basal-body rod protein FlgC